MTSTFDASTVKGDSGPNGAALDLDDDGPVSGLSALEQLRSTVADREEAEPWVHVVPARDVRLTGVTDVSSQEYQRWMRGAMPQVKGRRGGNPDLTRMDQFALTSRALLFCVYQVEVRNRRVKSEGDPKAWIVVTDPDNGQPLSLRDDKLLSTFGTPDARILVKRLIGRDADVISAGMELLEACGYAPGDGDDEDEADPT